MVVRSWYLRTQSGRTRVMVAASTGALVALIAAWFVPWQLTALLWWDVTAAVVVGTVWLAVGHCTPEQTRELAVREDDSRASTHLLLLGAALFSLVGVVVAFIKANEGVHGEDLLLEAFGVTTIVCSWLLVHTVFALRYAHLYYTKPAGGIDFKTGGREEPDYLDFAYAAFTIGMTFQSSDTDITQRTMRHEVLRHALISFLFGAVILATTVNLIASLLNT